MDKVSLPIPQQTWGGLKTKYPFDSPFVSSDDFLQGSKNFDTVINGAITKRLGSSLYATIPTAARDQYEAVFSSGVRHLLIMENGNLRFSSGGGTFSLVKSGYSTTANMEFSLYQDRVYFGNGVSAPQVYDLTQTYGGVLSLPATITVVDYTNLAGKVVTIGTTALTEGVDWTASVSNNSTATSLKTALETVSGVTVVRVNNILTVTSQTPYTVRSTDIVHLTFVGITYPRVRDMGCQTPLSAPTAPGAGSAGGSVPDGAHTYKVTFLYYGAEESNGSAASTVVNVAGANQTVALTAIPLGKYGVTARKIYRDDNDGAWLLVGQIDDNTTTTFTDTESVGTAAIPEANNVPPTFGLIILQNDRFFLAKIAGDPSHVFWTDAGHPNIVNSNNNVLCNPKDTVIGMVMYNARPIIFNTTDIGQILGSTSDTFFYSRISSPVGCVDNRSIQIMTTQGVPVLVWLSDKGPYTYNGNSIIYIGEDIEDQMIFNVQQSQPAKGRNTQTTTNDFNSGVASAGIVVADGSVSTIDPQKNFSVPADFENSTDIALATKTNDGTIQVATRLTPAYSNGTLTGNALVSGSSIGLTAPPPPYTGEHPTTSALNIISFYPAGQTPDAVAYKFIVPASGGAITSITFSGQMDFVGVGPATLTYRFVVWQDNFGIPGGEAYTTGNIVTSPAVGPTYQFSSTQVVNFGFSPGTYWIGFQLVSASPAYIGQYKIYSPVFNGNAVKVHFNGWVNPVTLQAFTPIATSDGFTFVQNLVPSAGTYTSEIFDSKLFPTVTAMSTVLTVGGTYPAGSLARVWIDTSNDVSLSSPTSQNVDNGSGDITFNWVGGTTRYWRFRVELSTPDQQNQPTVNALIMTFPTTAIFNSLAIDTKEPISFDSLTLVDSVPDGTTVTLEIATSDNNIAYTAFGPFSGVVMKRYAKLKVTMTSTADNSVTPSVTSVSLKWTDKSTFQSEAIDTGVTPAGWELFTATTEVNGGILNFFVRTATTEIGLAAASYSAVTNNAFISATPNQFIQWKAEITSTPGHVPVIDDVTTNWFINSVTTAFKVASLFFNRIYYLALAGYGSSTNNLVYKYDHTNTWKRDEDLSVATLGLFFNSPYYGDGNAGKILTFADGLTDTSNAITLDVRLALKFGARTAGDMEDKVKRLQEITAIVKGTGALYQFYFSVDEGATWHSLQNIVNGDLVFASTNDGERHVVRMVAPVQDGTLGAYGRHILLRIVDATTSAAEIHSLKARAWIYERNVLTVEG